MEGLLVLISGIYSSDFYFRIFWRIIANLFLHGRMKHAYMRMLYLQVRGN